MTRWVSERLDVLADHATPIFVAGCLWMAGEFIAALGLVVMYR
jgi:hypothetical protein